MSRRFELSVVSVSAVPTRTCVGCGQRAQQSTMIRVVGDATGFVVVDVRRNLAGRGAWMHRDESCLRSTFSKTRLSRALRSQIVSGEAALAEALRLIDDSNRGHNRDLGTE